jgi:hypothetical protein
MTALKEAPQRSSPGDRAAAGRLFDPGGRRTLDDAVRAGLEGTSAEGRRCLVCGSSLRRVEPQVLECGSCGSTLR